MPQPNDGQRLGQSTMMGGQVPPTPYDLKPLWRLLDVKRQNCSCPHIPQGWQGPFPAPWTLLA